MMRIPEYLNLLACRKREFFKAKYSRGRLKGLRVEFIASIQNPLYVASILQLQNDGVALSRNIDLLLDKQSLETLVLLPAHLSVERTRLHTARNRYTGGQNKQLMVM